MITHLTPNRWLVERKWNNAWRIHGRYATFQEAAKQVAAIGGRLSYEPAVLDSKEEEDPDAGNKAS